MKNLQRLLRWIQSYMTQTEVNPLLMRIVDLLSVLLISYVLYLFTSCSSCVESFIRILQLDFMSSL